MSNAEEPKAGRWWLRDDGKVMFIAFDERTIGSESSCPIIAYRKPDCGQWYAVKRFVRRLPDDAGFDWKPEPEYPQYWTAWDKQYAYLRLDSASTHVCVKLDGTESDQCDWYAIPHDGRARLTKAEAEARIVKPAPIPEIVFDPKTFTSDWGPFEKSAEPDPEEWVTQDRVPARIGIDQESWIRTRDPIHWRDLAPIGPAAVGKMMHGQKDSFGDTLLLRCRRKDLPPLPESKPNRIPVRLYWYDGNVVARYDHTPPTDPSFIEIKFDPQLNITASGFYIEGSRSQQ